MTRHLKMQSRHSCSSLHDKWCTLSSLIESKWGTAFCDSLLPVHFSEPTCRRIRVERVERQLTNSGWQRTGYDAPEYATPQSPWADEQTRSHQRLVDRQPVVSPVLASYWLSSTHETPRDFWQQTSSPKASSCLLFGVLVHELWPASECCPRPGCISPTPISLCLKLARS